MDDSEASPVAPSSTQLANQPPEYPRRPGEPDCSYYVKFGSCGYGTSCWFNHPPRPSGSRCSEMKPQRPGEPDCSYYVKSGSCGYGMSCRFNHPPYGLALAASGAGGRSSSRSGSKASSWEQYKQIMEQNVETNIVEDFDQRPSKKAKCSESVGLEYPFPSPTISTSSLVSEYSESISSESDKQINEDPLPSPPPPTMLTLSPEKDESKHRINYVTYDYLPQDYTLTLQDECAHFVIEDSLKNDVLVKIDKISVKQRYLKCLLDKDGWLDDEVISAYICCLKDQLCGQNPSDAKVYFENPLVTSLLKRDGQIGIDGPTGMTNVVKNYLNHDMIHLPINIKDSHWYLASINVEKYDIQVLDSLCLEHNRAELTMMLRGLQYHLDILKREENLTSHNWKDLDVTKWTITEQLHTPIQKDSSSCGLFMLKFMEYWTGHRLSHPITQEMITSFRYKLAAILLCWEKNKAPATTMVEIDDIVVDPNDFMMSDTPFDKNQSTDLNSLPVENKYQSLMYILSSLSLDELVGGLCNYIKSINSAEALQKVWVRSSEPYPISLTLKKLQEILKDELPMDRDCFNLVVRKIMFDDIQTVKKNRGLISTHYLDIRFWMITDFGRHPSYRKKIDMEQLSYSVSSWPGIKYSVSSCRTVHIPIQTNIEFLLFILDKDTKTVYILDPNPIDPIYQRNPNAKYVHKLLWISKHLPKAMTKACPGSTWNENIFLWQQKIVHDIPRYRRELSGYLVTLLMSTWDEERLHPQISKDGYELRKQILGQLLAFKGNECEDNMPSDVKDVISCIRKTQNNMK